ncbi:MAG: hypothetical protein AB1601_16250 [Planctomycetota bacterium]
MRRMMTVALVLGLVTAASAATIYTNEAQFLAAISGGGGYMLEDFNGYTYGSFTGYTLAVGPQNGYAGTIQCDPSTDFLWSGNGDMSTNSASSKLHVTFQNSTKQVYSIGGFFYGSDINGTFMPGTPVVLTASDGTNYQFTPTVRETFVGLVATEPLTWFKADALDSPSTSWATMDHLYIDSPEPASLALLALGLLLRRR